MRSWLGQRVNVQPGNNLMKSQHMMIMMKVGINEFTMHRPIKYVSVHACTKLVHIHA